MLWSLNPGVWSSCVTVHHLYFMMMLDSQGDSVSVGCQKFFSVIFVISCNRMLTNVRFSHHSYFMMMLGSQGWLCFRGMPEIFSCICQILQQSVFIDPVTTVQKYFRGLVLISFSCNFAMFRCEKKILTCGVPTVGIAACRCRGVRPPLFVHRYWWMVGCVLNLKPGRRVGRLMKG